MQQLCRLYKNVLANHKSVNIGSYAIELLTEMRINELRVDLRDNYKTSKSIINGYFCTLNKRMNVESLQLRRRIFTYIVLTQEIYM